MTQSDFDGSVQLQAFLVTNKHVISGDLKARARLASIDLWWTTEISGVRSRTSFTVPVHGAGGQPLFREHPDHDVDVWVLDISNEFRPERGLSYRHVEMFNIATAQKREEFMVNIGEHVVVVGYPLGTSQGVTSRPLVRHGVVASSIGEELEEVRPDRNGNPQLVRRRGFLSDVETVHGSSGSPVVLEPRLGKVTTAGASLVDFNDPLLLGIVAETRFRPASQDHPFEVYVGLGFAFDSETIVETIQLFD
jgi:S1-C subfamily serine protease